MTRLTLPGGTDIAEVAFFAVDALPMARRASVEQLDELVAACQIVRMPTGIDGGYLLHAYVDEDIPPEIMAHCVRDDVLSGRFNPVSAAVAFGGLESTYQGFKHNDNIRSDATLIPAAYEYTVYRTEYPEKLMEDEARKGNEALTRRERRLLATPVVATLITILAAFTATLLQHVALAFCIAVPALFAIRSLARSERLRALRQRRGAWEQRYPSIVIVLKAREA